MRGEASGAWRYEGPAGGLGAFVPVEVGEVSSVGSGGRIEEEVVSVGGVPGGLPVNEDEGGGECVAVHELHDVGGEFGVGGGDQCAMSRGTETGEEVRFGERVSEGEFPEAAVDGEIVAVVDAIELGADVGEDDGDDVEQGEKEEAFAAAVETEEAKEQGGEEQDEGELPVGVGTVGVGAFEGGEREEAVDEQADHQPDGAVEKAASAFKAAGLQGDGERERQGRIE